MFNNLTANFTKIFDKLKGKTIITESDLDSSMREIRIALLEADVSLSVVKEFITRVKADIIGKEVIKSISPGQMIVKLVHEHLVAMLGSENASINLNNTPPVVIMMVGLQGSGKTTSSVKIAHFLSKQNKKVLVASLDIYRPAAQEQLRLFAKSAHIDSLEIIEDENVIAITKRAHNVATLQNYDVLILDTAGRLHIDVALMDELNEVKQLAKPTEILLVADSMTGQDAVNIASNFNETLDLTGIILTRIDGDSRGGAALSISSVTKKPIKFLGTGEKVTELEEFHPERIASRILDMGDILSMVEKASEMVSQADAEKLARKIEKGNFDLNDLAAQMRNIKKMGGIGGMLSFLPGIKKIQNQMGEMQIDEKVIARQEAIIYSMTEHERRNYKILNGSRKKRIAKGAGVEVQDVNRLLKQYQDMANMMKKFGKMDKKSLMRSGMGKLF